MNSREVFVNGVNEGLTDDRRESVGAVAVRSIVAREYTLGINDLPP